MSRGKNQKLKLLYLAKIFFEETDEDHPLSIAQLEAKLGVYDITADRKTLYTDFEELRRFGLDIIAQRSGKIYTYYLGCRTFELAELKLLVDSVQASKFITENKSRELIRKLESLASRHEAGQLARQVLISGRIKTMNESIYYNVDKIHDAIGLNRQITFKYFQWNMDKKPQLRHNGATYQVSPWHLSWDNENYYMIAYDCKQNKLKHYRVDKMKEIHLCDSPRKGQEQLTTFDAATYTSRLFGMYGGKSIHVTLEGEAAMAGVLIDRFGTDIPLFKLDENHFRALVEVALSNQFLGWVASLGGGVKITAPEVVVERMRSFVETLSRQYT